MANYFIKKDLSLLIQDADDPNSGEGGGGKLQRTLGVYSLVMLGVGAIIGAGIFSLIGTAAALYAGPAIVYSFVMGGILCAFAGLCYAEMAAMVPVSGSAYAYSYATMGELIAWIIGWDLVLEYTFGAVAVCSSWSGYFVSIFTKTLGLPLTDQTLLFTKGPWEQVLLSNGTWAPGTWNVPASIIAILLSAILYRGMKESTFFNNIIVIVKLAIILSFIGLGMGVIDTNHWVGNPAEAGLASLVPPRSLVVRNGQELESFGWFGVLTGAGIAFFAYIGFDAISTTAQECKNPRRDLPLGTLLSLLVTTILYISMALVITGVMPYQELSVPDPIALGVDRIVLLRGWSPTARVLFTLSVKVGAIAGLTSGLLLMFIAQSRIFYSMAKDGLLPWFNQLHPKYSTPHIATLTTGAFVALCAGVMPMSLVGELVSIGTLLAFALVCIGIPILRITHPKTPRPFKTPAYWFVAPAGTLACLWVMRGLPLDTWIRLFVWLFIGFAIYFGYGVRNSRLRNAESKPSVELGV
jgi:APA family basic amino acid/polyamine antiporter